MTFTDPTAPAGDTVDEIVCACAQIYGPDPAGFYTARVMIEGDTVDYPGHDTPASAWLAAARRLGQLGEHGLAERCEHRAAGTDSADAPPVDTIRLATPVDEHGERWDTRPGIAAPTDPFAGDPVAALWAPGGLSHYESDTLRRAFDEADHALRKIAHGAAELLRDLHDPNRRPLRHRMGAQFGGRLADLYAATATIDAVTDTVHHRKVLAWKHPPASPDPETAT